MLFNLKIYDLVGCGTSFVSLAPVSERDILFIFLLFITYLFCLALQEGVRKTVNMVASGQLSREGSVLPSTLTNMLEQEAVFSLPAKGHAGREGPGWAPPYSGRPMRNMAAQGLGRPPCRFPGGENSPRGLQPRELNCPDGLGTLEKENGLRSSPGSVCKCRVKPNPRILSPLCPSPSPRVSLPPNT